VLFSSEIIDVSVFSNLTQSMFWRQDGVCLFQICVVTLTYFTANVFSANYKALAFKYSLLACTRVYTCNH